MPGFEFAGSRSRILIGLIAGLAGVTVFVVMNSRRKRLRKLPSNVEWKEVGKLETIWLYPMKSGCSISLEKADVTPMGIREVDNDADADKYLRRDRCFIILRDDNHEMITARTYSFLLKVTIDPVDSKCVSLKFPGKEELILDTSQVDESNENHVKMWRSERVVTIDCGEKAAAWVTDVIKSNADTKAKFRLGYWPNFIKERRDIVKPDATRAKAFSELTVFDSGAYSDLVSFMLMTTSSMDDLNKKISPRNVSALQFRPNFYIRTLTSEPFQEDNWKWIRIGENVFRNVKPCTRCMMVTINPETCKRDPQLEPLKTLKTYRQLTDPLQRQVEGDSPVMGINIGLVKGGTPVSIGDTVYASKD